MGYINDNIYADYNESPAEYFSPDRELDDDLMQGSFMKIKVFGIGGGGGNAVARLRESYDKKDQGISNGDLEFIAANTDVMALRRIINPRIIRLQIGKERTKGMGAGAIPDVGRDATRDTKEQIKKILKDTNILFITAGMGGGTGTGGAPVVAQIAREMGILTVAVVTKPFIHEGAKKLRTAEEGIDKLRREVDVLIVVPNEKALISTPKGAPMFETVKMADEALLNCIEGVTNIMLEHTYINLDFADIRTVLKGKGLAHVGIGRATGDNRVFDALRAACSSGLVETNIEGATNLIVRVVMDYELSADDVNKALALLPEVVAPGCEIISGYGFNSQLKEQVEVTVIATGMNGSGSYSSKPPVVNNSNDILARKTTQNNEISNKEMNVDESNVPAYIRDMLNRKRS